MSTATASTSRPGSSPCASRAASWSRARRSTICRARSTSRSNSPASSRSRTSAGRCAPTAPASTALPQLHLRRRSGVLSPCRCVRSRQACWRSCWAWPAGGSGRRWSVPPANASVAVLPFDNLGGDEATGRLADGMTEDLITELTRFRALDVIARDATLAYKDKAVDVRQVGQALHVRYILDGAIQRQGERVRISARLVDTNTARDVWSERWDRPTNDVFAVQSELAESCRQQDRQPLFRRDHRRRSRSRQAQAAQQPYRLRSLSSGHGGAGARHAARAWRRRFRCCSAASPSTPTSRAPGPGLAVTYAGLADMRTILPTSSRPAKRQRARRWRSIRVTPRRMRLWPPTTWIAATPRGPRPSSTRRCD